MCLTNNIDGWRYKCPHCNGRSLRRVNDKQRNGRGNTTGQPPEWIGIPHFVCKANGHRFLVAVDMATKEFCGINNNSFV